jgi:hypothetical protein
MPLGGAGAILKLKKGDLEPSPEIGDQAGLDGAKLYAVAIGGAVHMGPGLDALILGTTGWGAAHPAAGVTLVRYADMGLVISRFHMADGVDPTKIVHWDLADLTSAIERVVSMPDWSGVLPLPIDLGSAGRFLRSNGAGSQPSWEALVLTNALLDGSNHSDTLAGAVAVGDLIHGNATPKWARIPIGDAGQVLSVVGGIPAWSSTPSAVEHNSLFHIKAIRATGCSIANGSDHLTTTGAQFAGVKQGDFVRFDVMTTAVWGAVVSSIVDDNEVVLDRVNTGSSQSGRVAVFTPGDHYNSAISEANGYVLACGRGTYDAAATPGGTIEIIRGPKDFEGYESGNATILGFVASTSTITPHGFNWKKPGTAIRAYVHVNDLTGTVVLRLGNPATGDFFVYTNLAQDLLSKRLTTACKIKMDGTATYAVFQSAANLDRLGFDLTPMSALRSVSWPDYAGRVHVEGAPVTFTDTDTTPSVAGSRVFLTANTGATSITAFDDSVDGQEITVVFGDNNTTIVAGANMKTVGAANIVGTTDDVVRFVRVGANWHQASPIAVNA